MLHYQGRCNKIHLDEIRFSYPLGLIFHCLPKTFCYILQFLVFLPTAFEHVFDDTYSIYTCYWSITHNADYDNGDSSTDWETNNTAACVEMQCYCIHIVTPTRAYTPHTMKAPTQRKNPIYKISESSNEKNDHFDFLSWS